MTTSTNYITDAEFRDYIRDPATNNSDVVNSAITAASRAVDTYCGRFFYQLAATVRYFSADFRDKNCLWLLPVADIATVSGLTVATETGNDGTYPTSWTINTDFIVEPINQEQNGIQGWPYTKLRAISGKVWPIRFIEFQRDTIKITATWGWAAVPEPVKQATKIIAAQLWKLGEAPFGVAGWGAYGDIKVREIPQAAILLAPYRKMSSAVGVA